MIKLVITYLNDQNKTEVLISVVWKNSRRFVFVLRKKSPANKTAYLIKSSEKIMLVEVAKMFCKMLQNAEILDIFFQTQLKTCRFQG